MNLGCSHEEIMQMKTPLFAMYYKHSRAIKRKEKSEMLMHLCDVVSISLGDGEYFKKVKDSYFEMTLPEEKRLKRQNPTLFDINDKEQADQVAAILKATFIQKSKLRGFTIGG